MNKKKIILTLTSLMILSGFVYLNYIRGIYVVITNTQQSTIENIVISCRGFSKTISIPPDESETVKLNFNQSGDNSLTISYKNEKKTVQENFGYFENFPYKGTFEIELNGDKIKLVKDTVSTRIL